MAGDANASATPRPSWRSRPSSRRRNGPRSRTAIRSRPTTRSSSPSSRALAPGFDWKRYLARAGVDGQDRLPGRRASPATSRPSARLLTRRRCRCGRPTSAGTCSSDYAPYLSQAVRRRALRVLRHLAARHPGEPAALEARRRAGRRRDRRGARQALRRASTSRRRARRAWTQLVANLLAAYRQSIDALDWMSPTTQAEGAGQAREVHAQDRLSGQVARLLALEIAADDLVGNVDARATSSSTDATSPSSASRSTATSGT